MKQSEAARSEQTLFSARGIVKSFGSNAVLKGIDLSVGEGEVLA